MTSDNARLAGWSEYLTALAQALVRRRKDLPLDGAFLVTVHFALRRPKGDCRPTASGQPYALRKSAPVHHLKKPDLDKLTRAALDPLTGLLWRDDSQVIALHPTKSYARSPLEVGMRLRAFYLPPEAEAGIDFAS